MSMEYRGFEPVIGIEAHAELLTTQKVFCSCRCAYGDEPNTNVCPVCLGYPGAMPVLNPEAVKLAVAAGISLDCKISEISRFDRKHYFYPDLPKGYQITQYYDPICRDGEIFFFVGEERHRVGIERIHIEEDAGKLTYRDGECIADYNRCGVPLVEIVSAPDMRSSEEAVAYLRELRRRLVFAKVSDCKMNEGSLRFDVNISVRRVGDDRMGSRCEIKNINSVNYVGRAIESELIRQTELILSGGTVVSETRRYKEESGTTERMRDKEIPQDYRYIREPDIPPILTDAKYTKRIAEELGEPLSARVERLVNDGVRRDAAEQICSSVESAEYFDAATREISPPTAAPLFISEILRDVVDGKPCRSPEFFAQTVCMYEHGDINIVSARRLLSQEDACESAEESARLHGLMMIRDASEIRAFVEEAVRMLPKAAADVLRGKKNAAKSIVGQAMRLSGGRADPASVSLEVRRYFDESADSNK